MVVANRDGYYHKLVFRGEFLVGAVIVGDIRSIGHYRWLIAEQRPARFLGRELGRKIYNFSAYRLRVAPWCRHS
ncbi:MAG: hypothetical protein IMW96_11830 [Thermoanaerobacteraceae bacterium]|nr:hypothetical protein [Thermoanaerobacteraceae bacterium]